MLVMPCSSFPNIVVKSLSEIVAVSLSFRLRAPLLSEVLKQNKRPSLAEKKKKVVNIF